MKKYFIVIAILFVVYIVLRFTTTPDIMEGTALSVTANGQTVFGNNEDRQVGEPVVYFREATENFYGSIMYGYQLDGEQIFEGGINDAGLAWDTLYLPYIELTPHAGRRYRIDEDDIFVTMLSSRGTVEEALRFLENVDFGPAIQSQFFLSDATGEAVIVSPSLEGELEYTYITDTYLIATNLNPLIAGHGTVDDRQDTAREQLEAYTNEDLLDYTMDVMEHVKLNSNLRFTMYSVAADLTNGTIQLVYKQQYEDPITFQLDDMLEDYNQQLLMRDLFPTDVVEQGNQTYQEFESSTRWTQTGAMAIGVALNLSVVVLLIKTMQKPNEEKIVTE